MKVGIVTLTDGENYGNVLQNFAVQELLAGLSYEAETIRNTTRFGRYLKDDKKVCKASPSYIKKYVKSQLNYRYNIKNTGDGILRTLAFCKKKAKSLSDAKAKRTKAFKDFTESLIKWSPYTLNINEPWDEKKTAEYDFYISGSDQVWNPNYPFTSSINFLTFAPKAKRISLSASFGVGEIPARLKDRYAEWLKGLAHISVREERGAELVKELSGRGATVLCDPTMALGAEKWVEIEKKPDFISDEKYLLTYFLGDKTREYKAFIDSVAEERGLRVINLFDVLDLDAYGVSPAEFIYLIHNADLVCTDSFHGTVFSIMMKTDFVVFPRVEAGGSMSSRIQTLLEIFSLKGRCYNSVSKEELFGTDFSLTDEILKAQREEAFAFLKSALQIKQEETKKRPKSVYSYIKKNCCGCSACAETCPVGCIEMKADSEGFSYPEIDADRCINCGKCNAVCPWQRKAEQEKEDKDCFAAFARDREVRRSSSSGGVFSLLAKSVIDNGGAVFGAAFDEKFKVVHTVAENEEDLAQFRGSKYVQSEIGDAYKKAELILAEGKTVLFTGTPCQIKGIKTYLGKDYDNLITQDIICHGVPSPAVFERYLEFVSPVIKQVSFRDKKYGWHYFSMRIKGRRKQVKRLDEDVYLRLFLDNTTLRPSCYDCLMKKEESVADITLADCWNKSAVGATTRDDDKGLSLVIVNSKKGKTLFGNIGEDAICAEKVDTGRALKSQSAIDTSVAPNPKRAVFFEAFATEDAKTLFSGWYKKNPVSKAKRYYVFLKTKLYGILKRR